MPPAIKPVAFLAALAVGGLLAGLGIAGLTGRSVGAGADPNAALPAPPPVVTVTALPGSAPAAAPAALAAAASPRPTVEPRAAAMFARNSRAHVRAGWVAGYYPLYEAAARAYGVNWLLIASIHKQETAFSTSAGIYHGLNFANCCAGPMQFNVTNGPRSTWSRYRDAYRAAPRPASYNHQTSVHPSVYDDFDAIMAAAKLLRDSGAGRDLDGSAWLAAYDYYGHDLTGVDYADQVLARALSWGVGGFCINCEADGGIAGRVTAAWGAPMRAALAPPKPSPKAFAARKR